MAGHSGEKNILKAGFLSCAALILSSSVALANDLVINPYPRASAVEDVSGDVNPPDETLLKPLPAAERSPNTVLHINESDMQKLQPLLGDNVKIQTLQEIEEIDVLAEQEGLEDDAADQQIPDRENNLALEQKPLDREQFSRPVPLSEPAQVEPASTPLPPPREDLVSREELESVIEDVVSRAVDKAVDKAVTKVMETQSVPSARPATGLNVPAPAPTLPYSTPVPLSAEDQFAADPEPAIIEQPVEDVLEPRVLEDIPPDPSPEPLMVNRSDKIDIDQDLSAEVSAGENTVDDEEEEFSRPVPVRDPQEATALGEAQMAPPPAPRSERIFWTDAPDERRWRAVRGESIEAILDDWADEAGVILIWNTDNRFAALSDISTNGTFEEAVEALLSQYAESRIRPRGQLYINPDNGERTLVVGVSGF